MEPERISIRVVCAEPERQTVRELEVPEGCTAAEALETAGVLALHPGLDASRCTIGIFGREVPPDQPLRQGDRVEVLRPLREDPRERRRRLARHGATMSGKSAGRG